MGAISKPTQDQNAKNSPMPIAPATIVPWAGKLLNAFTGLMAAKFTFPWPNRKMSKMIRMATSLIRPIASTFAETRTSK